MIDQWARKHLPRVVSPCLRLYAHWGLHPNTVSLAGFVLALLAALSIAWDFPLLALALWWLGRLCDGTDGIWARSCKKESPFGAYLDIVYDMAAYSAMAMGFAYLHPHMLAEFFIVLALYTLCITSALALGFHEARLDLPTGDNRGLRLGAGLAEGGETGLAYTAFALFPNSITVLVYLWITVLLTTIVLRTIMARRLLCPKQTLAE